MTHTSTNSRIQTSDASVDAVLFDLSGTLLDESYARHGLVHLAAALNERWDIDTDITRSGFMEAFRAVSAERADQPFYMMRDVVCAALNRLIASCGHAATNRELVDLEHQFWAAAIPAAVAADEAIETLTLLSDAGIRTGIVSYADVPVFNGLLEQTGLAGLTDVEVCSEMARSCKPHPAIFLQALAAVGAAPADAMFVGDSVEADIVGGNRVGMHTALLSAQEFTLGESSSDDPLAHPDHHINHLLDVVDLVLQSCPSSPCA
jgi:putative hydrolase of the HAD superfamily